MIQAITNVSPELKGLEIPTVWHLANDQVATQATMTIVPQHQRMSQLRCRRFTADETFNRNILPDWVDK